jgi:hypothetical protein
LADNANGDREKKTDREWKDKVTVLITAEAIIAGFMFAYGALNGQMLVNWNFGFGCQSYGTHCNTSGLMGTYIAGVIINAVVLTSFASILLLLNSLPGSNEKEAVRTRRFYWGYDLFLMAILWTAVYVGIGSYSIYHFTVKHNGILLLDPFLAKVLFAEFCFYAVILAVLLFVALVGSVRKAFHFFKTFRHHRHVLLRFLVILSFLFIVAAGLAYCFAV